MSKHLDHVLKNQNEKKTNPFISKGSQFKETQLNPEMSEEIPTSLTEIENQINKLHGKSWEILWLIGKRLLEIKEKYLKDLDYLNISDYAKEKFNFSHTTTVHAINLSNNFSLSCTRNFGSKLRLLLPLENNMKDKYLEWMEKESPTYKQIQDKIKEETKPKIGRPKQDVNLSKTKMTVDFKRMGRFIPKEKSNDFLKELNELIDKYSTKQEDLN